MHNSWRAKEDSNGGLIDKLKEFEIIKSKEVEDAMRQTDRGIYSAIKKEAYVDHPHPIGWGATISAPHMHAHCLELLKNNLYHGAKVLDVGSGSGYLTACMARMVGTGGKVIGIEYIQDLVKQSISNMNEDDPKLLSSGNVILKGGDGWKGDADNAPFDAIHVGAAAATIPTKLVEQLKPGGKMIIPVGVDEQWLLLVEKDKDSKTIRQEKILQVRYVPLVQS